MIKSFNGKTPRVADSTFVSEMAYVIGDVEIGEGAGIWPGAVVRADFSHIKIGVNTQIEDNSVLHAGAPMEIGDNVIMGHSVVMHGRRIGNSTLIGNNATVLDNVEIGEFCIIAAGSLVETGRKIPDRSFVAGVPGKVTKETPPKMIQRIQEGSKTYAKLARQFKEQGL